MQRREDSIECNGEEEKKQGKKGHKSFFSLTWWGQISKAKHFYATCPCRPNQILLMSFLISLEIGISSYLHIFR